ncbi:transposase [Gloeobacter morelensis MG652769]|uniref:Transposase n=1 Tax=Gloeobacter morelensis MG652769 TaxID=2781736 RepID=A0ABY3PJ24_9CYAN|nr:transposase [Gloeobacter morelensis MG652769]
MLPARYPPWNNVYDYMYRWKQKGLWEKVCAAIRATASRDLTGISQAGIELNT